MVEISEFSENEVGELQRYIETHVQNTILQKIYLLTENPFDRAMAFTTIFRILASCKNYASTPELRNKLERLLDEGSKVYNEIYPLVLEHENYQINFGKSRLVEKIIVVLVDKDKNETIAKIINAFLVFGEKIELNRMEKVIGIDLENDYGQEMGKEIRKVIEEENI